MEEILEAADVIADSGLEGAVTWILRMIGLVAVLAGVGLWLFTDMGLLVVPALLIAAGLALLIVPGILLAVAEITG